MRLLVLCLATSVCEVMKTFDLELLNIDWDALKLLRGCFGGTVGKVLEMLSERLRMFGKLLNQWCSLRASVGKLAVFPWRWMKMLAWRRTRWQSLLRCHGSNLEMIHPGLFAVGPRDGSSMDGSGVVGHVL